MSPKRANEETGIPFLHELRAVPNAGVMVRVPSQLTSCVAGDEVRLGLADFKIALVIAHTRLTDVTRMRSTNRAVTNMRTQFRGAAGEIAFVRWCEAHGLTGEFPFLNDELGRPDALVAGTHVEIMTAAAEHQDATGFCVPPSKLKAAVARSNGRNGLYVFVGVPTRAEEKHVFSIRAAAKFSVLQNTEVVTTTVKDSSQSNHVVPRDHVLSPRDILAALTVAT
jgi:hypothetical protein